MNSPNIEPTFNTYIKVAYIEIAIYTIIALYFIQKFLVKYYVREIKQNKGNLQKNPSYLAKGLLAGESPASVFNNLIISRFTAVFKSAISPINNMFSSVNDAFSRQLNSINTIRNFMSPIRNFISDATGFFYKQIEKFTVTIMYTFHRLRQTFRRSLSGFNLIFHTLEHSKNLILSTMNSKEMSFLFSSADTINWILNSINRLCFDKDTLINTVNGYKKISELDCNTILTNNYVTAIIECSNDEFLYKIHSNNQDIYVSGSHIIYDKINKKWCCVKDCSYVEKTNYKPDKLYSISTSNHKIEIDDHLFSDYEEISCDRTMCLAINYLIMSHLNNKISTHDNLYNIKYAEKSDTGFSINTLIKMDNNTYCKIQDINIGDLLYGKNKVIGIVKILAGEFDWYEWNGIKCTDNCKLFLSNVWNPVNHPSAKIQFDDHFGYNLITTNGYLIANNNQNDYKFVDFTQINNNDILDKINDITLRYMNRK